MADPKKTEKQSKPPKNESKEAKALRKARESAPDLSAVAARLAELKTELDSIAAERAELESREERTQEHYTTLHASYFGSDYGIIVGGAGTDETDDDGLPIVPDWESMMGDVPDADADDSESE